MSKLADVLPASPWLRPPAALLVASACAEIALLPIGAFVFSRVTFAGLIVNFAAIPLMAVVQIAGMAAVGFTWLVARSCALDRVDCAHGRRRSDRQRGTGRRLSLADATACAPAAGGHRDVLRVSRWRRVWATFSRLATAALIMSGLWIVATPVVPTSSVQPLRVTFLDVGQGDAAIVQFPDGRTLSIDAGRARRRPRSTSEDGSSRRRSGRWAFGGSIT